MGEGTEDTRRRILKQDLITAKYNKQLIDNVIQKLADNKLIVTRDKAKSNSEIGKQVEVDVAHEALIRNWLMLRQWLEDNRDYLRQKRKLEDAAQEWISSNKNDDYLLQGARLIEAESYIQNFQQLGMLDEVAAEFITESQNLRTKQEQEQSRRRQEELDNLEARRKAEELAKIEAQQREQVQRQAIRKLRLLSTLAVTVGIVASVLGVNSYFNSQKAELKQTASYIKVKLSLSNEIERLLESIELAGDNQKFNQRSLKPSTRLVPEAQSALYQAVQDSRERSTFNGHQDSVKSVGFSPDGNYLVSGSDDNTVKLWDVKNQSLVHTFNGHQDWVLSVGFSRDGNYLVSGSLDKTVKLWDMKKQSLIHTFNGHQKAVSSVRFSPDGNYLVSGSLDKTVKLWDIENQSLVHTFNGHQDRVNSVEFSPDGNYLVSGSGSILTNSGKTVKLWDVKKQSLVHTFNGHQKAVNDLGFSRDGNYLVTGSSDKTVKLWDVKSQSLIHTFNGHQQELRSVGFSRDGNYLVSASNNNTVKLWRGTDWQDWLEVGCERIRLHPTLVSQETDLAKNAANTCLKYGRWSDEEKAEFFEANKD